MAGLIHNLKKKLVAALLDTKYIHQYQSEYKNMQKQQLGHLSRQKNHWFIQYKSQ